MLQSRKLVPKLPRSNEHDTWCSAESTKQHLPGKYVQEGEGAHRSHNLPAVLLDSSNFLHASAVGLPGSKLTASCSKFQNLALRV